MSATWKPFKRRRFDKYRPVQVYRNLNKSMPGTARRWYSVCQDGLVVAHTSAVAIRDAEFVVQEGGRQRSLREKRRNVHAYVQGVIIEMVGDTKPTTLPVRVLYDLFAGMFFAHPSLRRVNKAASTVLNQDGCTAAWVSE